MGSYGGKNSVCGLRELVGEDGEAGGGRDGGGEGCGGVVEVDLYA